jgi:hypothetical protein
MVQRGGCEVEDGGREAVQAHLVSGLPSLAALLHLLAALAEDGGTQLSDDDHDGSGYCDSTSALASAALLATWALGHDGVRHGAPCACHSTPSLHSTIHGQYASIPIPVPRTRLPKPPPFTCTSVSMVPLCCPGPPTGPRHLEPTGTVPQAPWAGGRPAAPLPSPGDVIPRRSPPLHSPAAAAAGPRVCGGRHGGGALHGHHVCHVPV